MNSITLTTYQLYDHETLNQNLINVLSPNDMISSISFMIEQGMSTNSELLFNEPAYYEVLKDNEIVGYLGSKKVVSATYYVWDNLK